MQQDDIFSGKAILRGNDRNRCIRRPLVMHQLCVQTPPSHASRPADMSTLTSPSFLSDRLSDGSNNALDHACH